MAYTSNNFRLHIILVYIPNRINNIHSLLTKFSKMLFGTESLTFQIASGLSKNDR